MNRDFGKKTKGCFSSKARFSAVSDAFCSSIANRQLPIVYTGFVQRGLPRSSPKNAAAPLYKEMSRKLADTYELSDKAQNFMGVRKGRMVEWQKITTESTDPKVPHETEKEQTGVYKEVTDYGIWYNKQLLRAVEILQCTTEFAGKHKSGQEDISAAAASDLIALLTLHEEDMLKHLMKINWKTGRESHVFRFFDDPYHKLDANGHIMLPVHVPCMMSYSFFFLVEGLGDHVDHEGQVRQGPAHRAHGLDVEARASRISLPHQEPDRAQAEAGVARGRDRKARQVHD